MTGIFAGLVISLFRWGLTVAEEWRVEFYHELVERDWSSTAMWFVALLFIGVVLYKLTRFEPMAAGSGIPQVKGALLGLIKMRWFHVMWVKLTAGRPCRKHRINRSGERRFSIHPCSQEQH